MKKSKWKKKAKELQQWYNDLSEANIHVTQERNRVVENVKQLSIQLSAVTKEHGELQKKLKEANARTECAKLLEENSELRAENKLYKEEAWENDGEYKKLYARNQELEELNAELQRECKWLDRLWSGSLAEVERLKQRNFALGDKLEVAKNALTTIYGCAEAVVESEKEDYDG